MRFKFKRERFLQGRGAKCAKYACPSSLTKKRKWKKLNALLRSVKNTGGNNPMFSCKCEQCAGRENLLHLACQYNSPEYTINKLLKIFPKYAFELDHKHRLPLHVAIENDGEYSVVKSLLRENEEGAIVYDENGRSPLLSYFYGRSCRTSELTSTLDSNDIFPHERANQYSQDMRMIDLIRSISFLSILNIDNDKKGVLEYAMGGGADEIVLSILIEWKISAMEYSLKKYRSFETIETISELRV